MDTWRDDCPARGAALSHAHWSDCRPPENHPGMRAVHMWNVCCHCEEVIGGTPAAMDDYPTPPEPGTADHAFVPTMTGLCLRCRQPQVAHPMTLSRAEAEEQAELNGLNIVCPVDHKSITPRVIVSELGKAWSPCPQCGVQLEPALFTGKYPERGRGAYGLGRGEFSLRDQLRAIARVDWGAWLGLHGGGEQE